MQLRATDMCNVVGNWYIYLPLCFKGLIAYLQISFLLRN